MAVSPEARFPRVGTRSHRASPGRPVLPGARRLRSDESGATPQTYSFTEKTTFVDENGNVVSRETIRNQPVTVTYAREGDRMVVSKVIVSPGGGRVIQRKESTTEEHTVE